MNAFQNAAGPQNNRFHMGGVGKHRDDDIGRPRHFRIASFCRCASCDQIFYALGHNVIHMHFMACFQQVFCHRPAHNTQANKSDFHNYLITSVLKNQ